MMHKNIIRILTRSEYRSHSEPLYRQLSIMNLSQMHGYFVSMHAYKIVNHLFPDAWCYNIFSRNSCSRLKLQIIAASQYLFQTKIMSIPHKSSLGIRYRTQSNMLVHYQPSKDYYVNTLSWKIHKNATPVYDFLLTSSSRYI